MVSTTFALILLLMSALPSVSFAADPAPGPDPRVDPERTARGYLGAAVCGECHQPELDLWRGSHHDLAMKLATDETVLGDFSDATFTAHGVSSRFFRRDGAFFVHTDGPDGEMHDYPIAYTFGWYPLQQYLIEFPGGRLQSLGLAWDSRPEEEGGQRWFHLYPEGPMDHQDPLHWTAMDQTWNYQCADCHSTDLQKRYDPELGVYDTRYAEINVACEACHGPGANHVEWARAAAAAKADEGGGETGAQGATLADPTLGLLVDLSDRDGGQWKIDPDSGKPYRAPEREARIQTQTCAPCHSRRGRTWESLTPGESLHQGHRLALLEPNLYFPDGQIKDEVYVYGSFLQSRMYHQGVVCSDCHDPHSLKPRAEGNGVCARCHIAASYDTPTHHHHVVGTPGAGCIDCHMTQRLYMIVDERADHSMRIPRPDLSAALGTPDACTGCHQDKGPEWAAEAVQGWYPESLHRGEHFGAALHAADSGTLQASARLLALAGDPAQPPIARASALERLHEQPSPESLMTVSRLLADPDPMVREQAVRFLDLTDLRTRVDLAWPSLSDPVRGVRLEAARVLAPVMRQGIGGKLADQLAAALEDYAMSQTVNADRPEAHLNLGLVAASAGEARLAEQAYRQALKLDPNFTPARVNLADLYRAQDRAQESEAELRAGLVSDPRSADLHHALGLALVRAQRLDEALRELARAADLAPDNTRYAYVHGVALDSAGRTSDAIKTLESALEKNQTNQEILVALVQYNVKLAHREAANHWLEKLAIIAPGTPLLEQFRQQIDQIDAQSSQADEQQPGSPD